MDVFGPRRRGLRSGAVLGTGAVAGCPVPLQHVPTWASYAF